MKKFRLLGGRARSLALALFLLCQLLLARDSLVTTAVVGFTRGQLLLAGLTCLMGLAVLVSNRGQWKELLLDRRLAALGVAAAVILLPCLFKRDWQLMYLSILFCLAVGVLLSLVSSCQEIARYYVVLLTALGVYSMAATYGLRYLAEAMGLPIPVLYNSLDVKFYNFGLAFVSESYVKNRNFGIFREPGVYQYFILLALYLANYHVRWKRGATVWVVSALLAATMLTTLATGGVVELGLFALFLFFDKKLYRKKAVWAVGLTFLAVLALGLFLIIRQRGILYWELYGMTVGKFLPGQESGTDRLQSLWADMALFLRHPLLGTGVERVLNAAQNNTSSTGILFAMLGVLGGGLHVAGWAALTWSRERGAVGNLFLLLILFMAFNTQNLTADVFLWLFPTMALAERLPVIRGKGGASIWSENC